MRRPDAAAAIGLGREPLSRVLALLDRDGEEARVIGGAVRNALMGLPVSEVDIATTAVPEEVTRRCVEAGLKAVPTGIEHGTVTVVVHGAPYEVTTLRQDIETYGRKAKVAFGRDWAADAKRRDFTINALSASRDGAIHDYVDGMPDIAARRVRFVGEPATRIAEDYLRILRFFRFHAAYGHGDLDPAGLHACIVGRAGLDALSRERVRMELMKLLAAPHAAETLSVMSDSGILQNLLGGIGRVAPFADMVAVEAVIGAPRDPVRGLGALGVAVVEDAERLRQRLRLTNAEHARLQSMADGWWRIDPSMGEAAAKVLLYRLGPANFLDRVMLAWARSGAQAGDARWRDLATLPEHWTAPAFPLKAADFLARGVEKGPRLGKALAAAESAWLAAGFPSRDVEIQAIAERCVTSLRV
jgi:tRNA nucleotidyltransferase/poly(A) polymerase